MIGLMKDELCGQIMKRFVALRAKTYSYLKENNDEYKKAKGTKKCIIKTKVKLRLWRTFKSNSNWKKIELFRKEKNWNRLS